MVEHTGGGRRRQGSRRLSMAGAVVAVLMASGPVTACAQDLAHGLIVKLRPAGSGAAREGAQVARERLASAFQGAPIPIGQARALGDRAHVVRWSRPLAPDETAKLIASLQARPDVEWAVPNLREPRQQSVTPDDPRYADGQWWLSAGSTDLASGGVPAIASGWTRTTGADIAVAVIDSGLRRDHPDLAGPRFATGYDLVSDDEGLAGDGDGRDADFEDPGDGVAENECGDGNAAQDSTWHGTFIAGQIGALTGNGVGVAGINRQARVVSVRVATKCGALVSDIVDGMRWAAGLRVYTDDTRSTAIPLNPYPARVVNISFGSANTDCRPYQDAIDELRELGVLVVAAAGNQSEIVHRPARCLGVLGVGAVNRRGFKTSYSNAGHGVDLSTVGGDFGGVLSDGGLLSTSNTGSRSPLVDGYVLNSGTSFSAPIVAGVATLMLSSNPDLSLNQLVNGLTQTARPHVTGFDTMEQCSPDVAQGRCLCTTDTCGAGLLDAPAALAWAVDPPPDPDPDPDPDNGGDGGGGGAMGAGWLVGLAMAVVWLARGRRRP